MTRIEVIKILRKYFESLFPRACPNCKRCFDTLREYISSTTPVGMPISFEAEKGLWDSTQLVGTQLLSNCSCGSTLALSTESMEYAMRLKLLNWVKREIDRRRVNPSELLEGLRIEVRKQVLSDLITEEK